MNKLLINSLICANILALNSTFAATLYTEANSGDLSNLPETPTSLGTLSLGQTIITGVLNESGLPFAPDAFTFAVAADQVWTGLQIEVSTTGSQHFLAVDQGTKAEQLASELLIATLVSDVRNGVNILSVDNDGGSFGAQGTTAPLTGEDYTIWFQETTFDDAHNSYQIVDYTITLTTTLVPEPSTFPLIALGILCVCTHRRR